MDLGEGGSQQLLDLVNSSRSSGSTGDGSTGRNAGLPGVGGGMFRNGELAQSHQRCLAKSVVKLKIRSSPR